MRNKNILQFQINQKKKNHELKIKNLTNHADALKLPEVNARNLTYQIARYSSAEKVSDDLKRQQPGMKDTLSQWETN